MRNDNKKIEKRSAVKKAATIAAGVSMGVALSCFVIIGRGVKNLAKSFDGLRDDDTSK